MLHFFYLYYFHSQLLHGMGYKTSLWTAVDINFGYFFVVFAFLCSNKVKRKKKMYLELRWKRKMQSLAVWSKTRAYFSSAQMLFVLGKFGSERIGQVLWPLQYFRASWQSRRCSGTWDKTEEPQLASTLCPISSLLVTRVHYCSGSRGHILSRRGINSNKWFA